MKDNINKRILCDEPKCNKSIVPRDKWQCCNGHTPGEKQEDFDLLNKRAQEYEGRDREKVYNAQPLPTPEAAHDKAFQIP